MTSMPGQGDFPLTDSAAALIQIGYAGYWSLEIFMAGSFDTQGQADDAPQDWTGQSALIVALCFLLNMIDGMDVLIISYIAPALQKPWTVASGASSHNSKVASISLELPFMTQAESTAKLGPL